MDETEGGGRDGAAPGGGKGRPPGGIAMLLPALLLGGILALLLLQGLFGGTDAVSDFLVSREVETYRREPVMGTVATIKLLPNAGMTLSGREAAERAFRAVEAFEAKVSRYRPDSDISRLNQAAPGAWVAVDPTTWSILSAALRHHRLSDGAFDITVGPLMDLYDWRRGPIEALPDEAARAEAHAAVGGQWVRLRREGMEVALAKPGMRIDLGAIAKGYGVDVAARALREAGVQDAIIDIGGEQWILGQKVPRAVVLKQVIGEADPKEEDSKAENSKAENSKAEDSPKASAEATPADKQPAEGTPWRVGIRNPRGPDLIEAFPVLHDCAIATSGDYLKYFELEGERYSHILDPRTGLPVRGGAISVTIISSGSCAEADALATTVSVLGREAGLAYLRENFPKVAAYIVDDQLDIHRLEASTGPLAPSFSAAASAEAEETESEAETAAAENGAESDAAAVAPGAGNEAGANARADEDGSGANP